MNDPEELLRAARLAAPSEALDRRIREAFAEAAVTPSRAPYRPAWRWLGAVAATGIAAALLVIATHSVRPPGDVPTIHRFEAQGPMRELLLESPASPQTPPQFTVTVTAP